MISISRSLAQWRLYYYPSVSSRVAKICGAGSLAGKPAFKPAFFVVKTNRPEGRFAGKTAGPTWLGSASSIWLRLCCSVGQLVKLRPIVNRPRLGSAPEQRRLATGAQDIILPHQAHSGPTAETDGIRMYGRV